MNDMPQFRTTTNCRALRAALLLVTLGMAASCIDGRDDDVSLAPESVVATALVTTARYHGEFSPLYQQYLKNRQNSLVVSAAAGGGPSDTLAEYAAKCDIATHIHVPSFACETRADGSSVPDVPGQGLVPRGGPCIAPNVLNHVCDPGSRFQLLAQNAEAVVVAHCRKDGLNQDTTPGEFNDIAVIQTNRVNGATCFYQALGYGDGPLNGSLDGRNVVSPSLGQSAWSWKSPHDTEAITCTGCHNNGAIIRSPYLYQLAELPKETTTYQGVLTPYDNNSTPLKYVGNDYALNKSWSITLNSQPSGDTGAPCSGCHRMAVSNYLGLGSIDGSGGLLAIIATAQTQANKLDTSPIWMRPGDITYHGKCASTGVTCVVDSNCNPGDTCKSGAFISANAFNDCSVGFWGTLTGGFPSGNAVSGCTFAPLAASWTELSPAMVVAINQTTLM